VVTGDPRVTVITNGVDADLFSPAEGYAKPLGSGLRLLIPSRPALDKGFLRAVELAKALEQRGRRATLVIFDQPDGFTPEGLRQPAAESNRRVTSGVDVGVLGGERDQVRRRVRQDQ
jgi:glycosyltransferase involved in cell wall biosynthesis